MHGGKCILCMYLRKNGMMHGVSVHSQTGIDVCRAKTQTQITMCLVFENGNSRSSSATAANKISTCSRCTSENVEENGERKKIVCGTTHGSGFNGMCYDLAFARYSTFLNRLTADDVFRSISFCTPILLLSISFFPFFLFLFFRKYDMMICVRDYACLVHHRVHWERVSNRECSLLLTMRIRTETDKHNHVTDTCASSIC